MTKQELRKQYLEKRLQLSDDDYRLQCEALCNIFFATVDFSAVRVLHVFLPITKKREPNTFLIIERLKREYPAIKIVAPKVNSETNTLENYYLNSTNDLIVTGWGIPEPPSVNPANLSEIDIVIVPLLVFDETGNRVGYGKGFYDKFLSQCKSTCLRVGLSLLPPVKKIGDVESHDEKLHMAITPAKVYHF